LKKKPLKNGICPSNSDVIPQDVLVPSRLTNKPVSNPQLKGCPKSNVFPMEITLTLPSITVKSQVKKLKLKTTEA
jgi:hypothetical protein